MAQLKGYYIQPPSDLNLVRVQTSKSASGTAPVLGDRKVSTGQFRKFYGYFLWPEFDPWKVEYRRYYSQHGHSEWSIDALDRLKNINSEDFINTIELNKKLYFACQNADQVDPLILKIKVEELIKNGATNDYLEGFLF